MLKYGGKRGHIEAMPQILVPLLVPFSTCRFVSAADAQVRFPHGNRMRIEPKKPPKGGFSYSFIFLLQQPFQDGCNGLCHGEKAKVIGVSIVYGAILFADGE